MTPPAPALPTSTRPTRLSELPRRARGVVVGHGTDAASAERLAALGLGVGATFTVLSPGERARIRVGESTIGLGPGLACAVHALVR